MTNTATERSDIVVAGAGIAGLAAALAMVRAAGPKPRVVVCDPLVDRPAGAVRAVAIAPAPRRFLDGLGVWDGLPAQPVTRLTLGDSRPDAVPPPVFLRFDEQDDEPLAHIVTEDDLRGALLDACRAAGIAIRALAVNDYAAQALGRLRLADAGLDTRLLVASDGRRSRLREKARIGTVGRDYGQTAIVATLAHDRPHDGEALQVFLPHGPLAFLPMVTPAGAPARSSIVWTETAAEAERLMALGPEAFCEALTARGGHDRGTLTLLDTPRGFPLAVRIARDLVAPRLALVGDAARTIHPLAGQGLNLGLRDADVLARHVTAAMALGLDPGGAQVLGAYQRDRRADHVAMAAATDGLNRLFSNDLGPLRLVRDLGLGVVDRAPALKRFFIRRAAGL